MFLPVTAFCSVILKTVSCSLVLQDILTLFPSIPQLKLTMFPCSPQTPGRPSFSEFAASPVLVRLSQIRFVPFVIRCHRLFTLGYEGITSDYRLLLPREEYSRSSRKRTPSGREKSVRNWSWPLTRMVLISSH